MENGRKTFCPECGKDITDFVMDCINRYNEEDEAREKAIALINSIRKIEDERVKNGKEGDFDSEDYARLVHVYRAEDENIAQKHKHNTGEATERACEKAREQRNKNWDELLRDENRHDELYQRMSSPVEAHKEGVAYRAYAALRVKCTENGISKVMLYRDHSNERYYQIDSVKDIELFVQKRKKLRTSKLYSKTVEITEGNFIYAICTANKNDVIENLLWILGVDASRMFQDVNVFYKAKEREKKKRLKQRAQTLVQLK